MKRFTALLVSLLVILSCTAVFAAGASGDFHNPAEITYTVCKAGVPRDFTRAECCAFMRAIGLSVPDEVDEAKSYKIARDIKDRIEAEMQYPGTIKINVIRETRAIEEAK